MRHRPRPVATRLRTVWSTRTPQQACRPPADLPPGDAFAARLRAAVEAQR